MRKMSLGCRFNQKKTVIIKHTSTCFYIILVKRKDSGIKDKTGIE